MFGIGLPELILIMALALIVVGPDKLPDLARSIAKTLFDLKKTAENLKDSLNEEDNPIKDIQPQLEDAAKNFKETMLDTQTKTWKDTESTTQVTPPDDSPSEDQQKPESLNSEDTLKPPKPDSKDA